jgi:Flp pilus assembly protein TadD
VNPWCSQYHYRLARLLVEREQWPEAVAEGEAAVRLNPSSEDVRLLLIRCYLHTGKKDRARAELDTLLRLKPADAEALRRWFAGQAR